MLRGIFFKEWIKIRKYFYACFLLNLVFMAYYFFFLRNLFNVEHSEFIWYRAFDIGVIYYDYLKWPLLICGAIIGVSQFAFEMTSHRFRLSLHLPCSTEKIVFGHILIGLLLITGLVLMTTCIMFFVTRHFFPAVAAISFVLTALPWFFGGIAVYLGTALVFLEPSFYRKIIYLVISSGFIFLFFMGDGYEEYNRVFIKIGIIFILYFFSVFVPGLRYRMSMG
ncbi:MAG: hypothetical protein CSA18_04085 [Deltaproteobacteria bacterium]|nr:MAG: hypothetical protein CSA18_04085 [Deltaproteobacteria bacterium]